MNTSSKPIDSSIPIDHVVDGVYISGWRATKHEIELLGAGLTHVLKLYESVPYFSPHFTTLENVCVDGEPLPAGVLDRSVDFIRTRVAANQLVLVMCGAGISRSATMVLAYMVDHGYDLHEAYKILKKAHPDANPHPALWQSLITRYQLTYSIEDAVDWDIEFNEAYNPLPRPDRSDKRQP